MEIREYSCEAIDRWSIIW